MKPEQSKQECCISPLKRSRLTNNLNSSEICDLQSAGPDKENKTVNWSRVSQKIKEILTHSTNHPAPTFDTHATRENVSALFRYLHYVFTKRFRGDLWERTWIMGNILQKNTLSSKFETSVVFKKGNGRTIRLLCRDEVFTMKKY